MKEKKPYAQVLPIAQQIVAELAPYCRRIEIAGSLRRQKEFVGDIEIVALPEYGRNLFGEEDPSQDRLWFYLRDSRILAKAGKKYIQFAVDGHQIDLFMPATAAHWGSIFLIRTGSADFNMWIMRHRAADCGIVFRDGLVYNRASRAPLPTPTENDVFRQLHMDPVPPPARERGKWQPYVKDI